MRSISASMSASAGSKSLGLGDRSQGQVRLDGGDRASSQAVQKLLGCLSDRLQVLLDGGPLRLQSVLQVVDAALYLAVDQGCRRIAVDEFDQRFQRPVAQRHGGLDPLDQANLLLDVRPQLRDRVKLGRFGRPLVGDLGEDLLLHVFDEQFEGDGPIGEVGVEGQDVAGTATLEPDVQLGQHGAAAELVEEVVDGEAWRRPARRGFL